MIYKNQTWDEYRALEGLNGSTLALLLPPNSPAYLDHCRREGIGPSEDTTRVGSGLHSIVEALPDVAVDKLWKVMPDFKLDSRNTTATGKPSNSKTDWVREREKEFRERAYANDIDVIDSFEHRRIERMLGAISRNQDAMDLIVSSERELAVTAEIEGVVCKGRIDGVMGDVQWNLKTSTRGCDPRSFGFSDRDFHYTFKDALHWLLLKENDIHSEQFYYILVDDCLPIKDAKSSNYGKFPRPAECVLVDVPITVFESHEQQIRDAVKLYAACEESGKWPGTEAYTYVPYVPAEVQLVD